MYMYIYIYICMYIGVYIYIYVYVYVYMYTCTCLQVADLVPERPRHVVVPLHLHVVHVLLAVDLGIRVL